MKKGLGDANASNSHTNAVSESLQAEESIHARSSNQSSYQSLMKSKIVSLISEAKGKKAASSSSSNSKKPVGFQLSGTLEPFTKHSF